MPDQTPFTAAADRLADRFRSMPQSRLLGPVPGHPSRAAAGLALSRRLAATALRIEGEPDRELPDPGPFAIGDQLAVVAHDLAAVADADTLAEALTDVEATDALL